MERSTRERILDVALDLFVEQGYDKTSLREIAEKMGFSKAALYYHFASKADILMGLHLRMHSAARRPAPRIWSGAGEPQCVGSVPIHRYRPDAGQPQAVPVAPGQPGRVRRRSTTRTTPSQHIDMEERVRKFFSDRIRARSPTRTDGRLVCGRLYYPVVAGRLFPESDMETWAVRCATWSTPS